jgi:hypothetical protein
MPIRLLALIAQLTYNIDDTPVWQRQICNLLNGQYGARLIYAKHLRGHVTGW